MLKNKMYSFSLTFCLPSLGISSYLSECR